MIRKWHRLLAPIFALFLLIVAATGIATQATDLLDHATAEHHAPAKTAATPMHKPDKEQRSPLGQWNHWFKKLHSGEALGPIGIAANIATGAALLFFAGSGFYMYLTMAIRRWSRRR